MNRALLVGINTYPGCPLNGCVNDVTDMAGFLVSQCGFVMDEIRLLTDHRATKTAIVQRLEWLTHGVQSGDRILFHYSGHGAQMATRNPTGEVDKLDEVICPVDFDWSDEHAIRDKEFNRIFSVVPAGVEFIWISDSCHSGDLTKAFPPKGCRNRYLSPPADLEWQVQTAKSKQIPLASFARAASQLHVALLAGCKDNQTSADAVFAKRPNGAFTYFLLKELGKAGGLKEALTQVREHVGKALKKARYDQVPQLEGDPGIQGKPFLAAG